MKYQNASWTKNVSKIDLYTTRYLYMVEEKPKAFSALSRESMYEAILDSFKENPWPFYMMLSEETMAYLFALADGKTKALGYTDPRACQDDFALLEAFFVTDPEKGLNADYLPLIEQLKKEDLKTLSAATSVMTYIKGLMDIYGYIDNATLLTKVQRGLNGHIDLKMLSFYFKLTGLGYYYKHGTKYSYARALEEGKKGFLANRELYPELNYRDYAPQDVYAYANRFYFPTWKKEGQEIYGRLFDVHHVFAYAQKPYEAYFDDESGKSEAEQDAYTKVNESVAKWPLKGHTIGELEARKLQNHKPIVQIPEKDIGPEIFFPFKDTIVGVYNLAKETLHISGDVATADMGWDSLEKIKTEFYAHREEYIGEYIRSLGRKLTPYELDTIDGLRNAIPSKFIFHSLSKEGAILIDTVTGNRYLVHPLGMGFSEMLQGGYYDQIVSTTIIPFEDYLTYDSFISGSSLLIGTGAGINLDEGRLIRSKKDFSNLA